MIVFENKDAIDIRAIKTFGVNSKNNKDSAIGYFGTGLKYAIAILLRNNHTVRIITGGNNYDFAVNRSKIRNDEFDIVTMNGEELGYTTELGKGWDMWMAYRELHSNMLDENGDVYNTNGVVTQDDMTYVMITGNAFEDLYRRRDEFFLNHDNRQPKHSHAEVSAYEKCDERGCIFYKGVRVMQTRAPALFDYNHHTGLTLTEDRTIKDSWSTLYHVSALVTASTDKRFIEQMVTAPKGSYERSINFEMNRSSNMDTFLDVVGKLRKKHKDSDVINHTAIALHKTNRGVTEVMPGISCRLNAVQEKQLNKAVDFCKDTLNLELDDYRLIVCKDIGVNGDLGRANISDGVMYISKKCFDQGTKRVAVTILEEYTHCKHEVHDETVEQKWIYLEQIIGLGEQINGEPL